MKVAFEITKRAQHCVDMPMRAASRSRAKIIVTSFSRDLYSDRPKNNIIIKFSLCVIHVLQRFHSRIQRMEGVPTKPLGRATLNECLTVTIDRSKRTNDITSLHSQ